MLENAISGVTSAYNRAKEAVGGAVKMVKDDVRNFLDGEGQGATRSLRKYDSKKSKLNNHDQSKIKKN